MPLSPQDRLALGETAEKIRLALGQGGIYLVSLPVEKLPAAREFLAGEIGGALRETSMETIPSGDILATLAARASLQAGENTQASAAALVPPLGKRRAGGDFSEAGDAAKIPPSPPFSKGGMPPACDALSLHGLDEAQLEPTLVALNMRREYVRDYHLSLLLWVPEETLAAFPRHAKDFWSHRAHVARLEAEIPLPLEESDAARKLREEIAEAQAEAEAAEKAGTDAGVLGGMYDRLGDVCMRLPDWPAAQAAYQKALELFRESGNALDEGLVLLGLGNVQRQLGHPQAALPHYQAAEGIFSGLGREDQRAFSLVGIGEVQGEAGNHEAAFAKLNEALGVLRTLGNRDGEMDAVFHLAELHASRGEIAAARPLLQQALAYYREHGEIREIAVCLSSLGQIERIVGDPEQALQNFSEALALFRQVGDQHSEAEVLGFIGGVYREKGDHQQAMSYFSRALMLHRGLGNRSGEANVLEHLGLIQIVVAPDQALQTFQQSLAIFSEIGDQRKAASLHGRVGATLHNLNKYQEALEQFQAGLAAAIASGDVLTQAHCLFQIAEYLCQHGNLAEATKHYEQAASLYRQVGEPHGLSNTEWGFGLLALKNDQPQVALMHFQTALDGYRQIGALPSQADTLTAIAIAHQALNDLPAARRDLDEARAIWVALGREREVKDIDKRRKALRRPRKPRAG